MMLNLYTILLMGVTLAVILSRRTMYSILFLILLFALIAVFVYSLDLDFIGLIFVIVYVGAIATLFLFIVMMLGGEDWEPKISLNLDTNNLLNASGFVSSHLVAFINKLSWYFKSVFIDILIVFSFGVLLLNTFSSNFIANLPAWLSMIQSSYHTNMFDTSFLYGVFFYDYWYLPFVGAGFVLLIAMLGSIILTTRLFVGPDNQSSSKVQEPKDDKSASVSEDKYRFILPEDKSRFTLPGVSPELSEIVAKQRLKQEMPYYWLLPQLLWTGFCFMVGFAFKDIFIWSELTRWLYIAFVSTIYLYVSWKFVDYAVAKILSKKYPKS